MNKKNKNNKNNKKQEDQKQEHEHEQERGQEQEQEKYQEQEQWQSWRPGYIAHHTALHAPSRHVMAPHQTQDTQHRTQQGRWPWPFD